MFSVHGVSAGGVGRRRGRCCTTVLRVRVDKLLGGNVAPVRERNTPRGACSLGPRIRRAGESLRLATFANASEESGFRPVSRPNTPNVRNWVATTGTVDFRLSFAVHCCYPWRTLRGGSLDDRGEPFTLACTRALSTRGLPFLDTRGSPRCRTSAGAHGRNISGAGSLQLRSCADRLFVIRRQNDSRHAPVRLGDDPDPVVVANTPR